MDKFGLYLEALFRLILAGAIGGVIGWERGSNDRPAGLRTNYLVTMGSCLMMMVSLHASTLHLGGDPGRIAAQVVNGIGFVGAGTIMIKGMSVKGLTTAATLWVDAGIGLAIGAGQYFIGIMSGFLVIFALITLGRLEPKLEEHKNVKLEIHTGLDMNHIIDDIRDILIESSVEVKTVRIKHRQFYTVLKVSVNPSESTKADLDALEERLLDLPDVDYISFGDHVLKE